MPTKLRTLAELIMNPNWLGVSAGILAFVAFFIAFRATKNRPGKTRILLTLTALLLAIPGASFSIYYAHLFPEPSWYYQFRSIAGTEFLIILLGVAGGFVATLLPRRLLVAPLLGVAVFSFVPIIKPILGPISEGAFHDQWHGDICIQSTPSTCGAASLATILKHFGHEANEAEIAAEAHSYVGGTEAWYLARPARSRGFTVDFDSSSGFAPEGGLPVIAGVMLGSSGHFIAILEQNDDEFLVGDPLRGREILSREQLENFYDFTGFHMRIQPRSSANQ